MAAHHDASATTSPRSSMNMASSSPDPTDVADEHFFELLLQGSDQHRQAILITSAVSIAASLVVVVTILHDAYSVKAGESQSRAQYND